MILGKDQLPAAPRGHRVLAKPNPPAKETDGGLVIPEIAMHRPNIGVIIHAGLNARDAFHDHGDQVGDEIWWGKFAGVIEEWDRVVEENPKDKCKIGDHTWLRQPSPGDRMSAWSCSMCSSKRLAEPLIVLNHDDILCNVSLQRRIESGEVAQVRGKLPDGRTQHYIDRKDK